MTSGSVLDQKILLLPWFYQLIDLQYDWTNQSQPAGFGLYYSSFQLLKIKPGLQDLYLGNFSPSHCLTLVSQSIKRLPIYYWVNWSNAKRSVLFKNTMNNQSENRNHDWMIVSATPMTTRPCAFTLQVWKEQT